VLREVDRNTPAAVAMGVVEQVRDDPPECIRVTLDPNRFELAGDRGVGKPVAEGGDLVAGDVVEVDVVPPSGVALAPSEHEQVVDETGCPVEFVRAAA